MIKIESYSNIPDGCSKCTSCSLCPFPDCRVSTKDLNKGKNIQDRKQKVLQLAACNVPFTAIQERTGYKYISSIYRIIREGG